MLPNGSSAAAHTEYTRLLADHGALGVMAIGVLALLALSAVVSSERGLSRAWSASAVVWALAEMSHSAMRVALIGFVFGIGFLRIKEGEPDASTP